MEQSGGDLLISQDAEDIAFLKTILVSNEFVITGHTDEGHTSRYVNDEILLLFK